MKKEKSPYFISNPGIPGLEKMKGSSSSLGLEIPFRNLCPHCGTEMKKKSFYLYCPNCGATEIKNGGRIK